MHRIIACVFLLSALASACWAGPPSIRELRPWGAQRGQMLALTVAGDALAPGPEVFSAIPGKLEEQLGATNGEITYKLALRPDAAVGVYPIRLRTAGGLSNVLLFSVGDMSEIAETEPNDLLPSLDQVAPTNGTASLATLSLVSLPVTINGSARGTDHDGIRFAGKQGERIVAEVEAQRIGSPLDPALQLFSPNGHELAFADDTPGLGLDCRLDVRLPEDGEYLAVVHDSKYAGAAPGYYRLKMGQFIYAETVFPLGWQRGRDVEVTLLGGSLAQPTRMMFRGESPAGMNRAFLWPASQGSLARLPFRFSLSDEQERIEPPTDAIDERWFRDASVMNGRIAQAAEVDRYKFPVESGQTWIFEVDAASLGSPLDATLTVSDPQGSQLASADDGNGLDPRVQFTAPGGIDHVIVSVEDLHRRGGLMYAYRLKARTQSTDFSLQVLPGGTPPPGTPPPPPPLGPPAVNIPRGGVVVVQVSVARNGYDGPIQLTIPEGLSGITAEDGLIPAGAPSGLLVLSAAADEPLRAFDLEIRGHGGSSPKPMVRPAETAGRAAYALADAFVARVPAAVCETPPARFTVAERSIQILHGHNRQLKITVDRGPNATDAINISATGLPVFSVGGTSGVIAKDGNELTLTLVQNPELPQVGTFTMQLAATTPAAGRQETMQIPPVKVEIARPFGIELLSQSVTLSPGGTVRVPAIIRREEPFEGLVQVGPAGSLPQGVSLGKTDVPKGESLAMLELTAGDDADPAELELLVRASSDMEGRKREKEYVIPDRPLKVRIAPKPMQ